MANEGVNIPIKTTADTSGATAASASLNNLQKELKETQKQMKALGDASPEFAPLKEKAAGLEKQIDTLGDSHDKAGKKGANFGQGLNVGAQAVQDFAAAGLPGVTNQVGQFVQAVGLSAGAAGGLTLLAVGLDLILKNWSKLSEYFGDGEAAKKLWTQLTPDEEATERLNQFNDRLKAQAELLERITTARKNAIELQAQEDEGLQKRAELWKDIVPTPEESGSLPPLPGMGPITPEMSKAQAATSAARETTAGAVAAAVQANAAYQRQKKIVDDTLLREDLQKQKDLQDAQDKERLGQLRGTGSDEARTESASIQQRLKDRQTSFESRVSGLEMPQFTESLIGDPAKDNEVLKKALDAERAKLRDLDARRKDAASAAESTYGPLNKAETAQNERAKFESEQSSAAAFKDIGGLSLPPPMGQFAGADQRSGLTEALARLQQGQGASTQAAQQVASAADGVITEITQFQQRSVGTFSVMASIIKATNSSLASLQNEFESYRSNNVR